MAEKRPDELRAIPLHDELQNMTDDEVVGRYQEVAKLYDRQEYMVVPLAIPLMQMEYGRFYLEELTRRDAARANARMLKLTENIQHLTWVITGLTVFSVIASAVAVVIALVK